MKKKKAVRLSTKVIAAVAATTVALGAAVAVHHPQTVTCHVRQVSADPQQVLPDPTCTPGKVRTTNASDVCPHANTAAIRPPASYTSKLKVEQIKQYGYADTQASNYEEDHLLSLELGGDPISPQNLWPEFGSSPNEKDKVENLLHARVCAGQITLVEAQREITSDWTKIK